MNVLVFIGCLILGYVLIRYAKWIIDSTGIQFESAEGFLGGGGTYSIVKLLGLAAIIFGFWWLFK